MKTLFIALAISLTSLSNCDSRTARSADTTGNDITEIRVFDEKKNACSVDFKNFVYPSPFFRKESIRLKNGEQPETRFKNGLVNGMGFYYVSEYHGDLNKDGKKDAIVTMSVLTGGSSIPHVVYVYDLSRSKPKLLWTYISGDRADGGLRDVYAIENELIMELYDPQDSRGDCCPAFFFRINYSWNGRKFIETRKLRVPVPEPDDRFKRTVNTCD